MKNDIVNHLLQANPLLNTDFPNLEMLKSYLL